MEASHNGIAAVLKTAERKLMRVRVPQPPPDNIKNNGFYPLFFCLIESYLRQIIGKNQ